MTQFDWESIRSAKDAHRKRLAELPLSEKFLVLERLRERAHLLRAGSQPAVAAALASTSTIVPVRGDSQQSARGSIHIEVAGATAVFAASAVGVQASSLMPTSVSPAK